MTFHLVSSRDIYNVCPLVKEELSSIILLFGLSYFDDINLLLHFQFYICLRLLKSIAREKSQNTQIGSK